ncbi:unnamed protein product [Arabidopsis halleri]
MTKLTDFTFSISLPEGKSWIEDEVMGTFGYMYPIYYTTGLVTEYTDVFSFGIFMLGRPAVFAGTSGVHCNILDYVKDLQERGESVEFGDDLNEMRPSHMKMFLELALRCCEERNEEQREKEMVVLGQMEALFSKSSLLDAMVKQILSEAFSSDQLLKATDDSIEDRSYMIKMSPEEKVRGDGDGIGAVYNDIVISARVTNHSNFLKRLGCCLKFPFLVLVFEYEENGGHQGGIGSKDTEFLPWDVRLKVAKEITNAVTYLHMEFPRIIVHRNVTPMKVFLDENWKAKLHGMAPRSDMRFIDIRTYVRGLQEKGEFIETIFKVGVRDIVEAKRCQVDKFVDLTFRCCEKSVEKRPKMIDVAKELKRIERSLDDTPAGLR